MADGIKISLKDGAQHICINRPEKKNALTSEIYSAMANALNKSNEADDIIVNILYGTPGCFTAGNDINDFLKAAQSGALDENVIKFLESLVACQKPLILGVDGPAIGIGTTLVFHADLVYATETAQFKTPFLELGLLPEAASSYLMPLMIGHQRSYEMLVLGKTCSAEDARAAGFVNEIVPADKLVEHCETIAGQLMKKPHGALILAKQLMRAAFASQTKDVIAQEATLFKARLQSPEAREAFSRFLNKPKS